MYPKIKNVQILVALLKQHGIRHIVLSAGTRQVPLAHSVETDDFFKCYSVVDERSAGYFAMGLSKQIGEPVAIACTSSTATCNYYPPVTEAFYQKVPLLVLTGDRDPMLKGQMEDQMIDQPGMFDKCIKKTVSLPIVNTTKEAWYCQRLVNEALLELDHHGGGPVHINFPIDAGINDIADASVETPMPVQVIKRCNIGVKPQLWEQKSKELASAKRILILCGSGTPLPAATLEKMSQFSSKYNCVIATEHISNVHCNASLDSYLLAQALSYKTIDPFLPDIVITFGENYISRLKPLLKSKARKYKHWQISDDGVVCDPFNSLNSIFECPLDWFFDFFNEKAKDLKSSGDYFELLSNKTKEIVPPEADSFSQMYILRRFTEVIPENSILHLAILNSTRIVQFFPIPESVEAYSNVGSFGIDGSMSTLFGQSISTDKMCFLMIGDLSFFYDMNALGIRGLKNNIRIMMCNNGGGAEFHFTMGREKIPTIDQSIAAGHSKTAKAWVESMGFTYMSASNQDEYLENLERFVSNDHDKPIFFEVFTDIANDARVLREFNAEVAFLAPGEPLKRSISNSMEKTEMGKKLKKGLKKILK